MRATGVWAMGAVLMTAGWTVPSDLEAQLSVRIEFAWEWSDGDWRPRQRHYDPHYRSTRVATPRRQVHVPPGHLPPPGHCRLWYPGVPPGHQPPPFPCDRLYRYRPPAGAILLGGAPDYRPQHGRVVAGRGYEAGPRPRAGRRDGGYDSGPPPWAGGPRPWAGGRGRGRGRGGP